MEGERARLVLSRKREAVNVENRGDELSFVCEYQPQLKNDSLTDNVSTALVFERSHIHSGRSDRVTGMKAIPWKNFKHTKRKGVDTELQTHRTIRYSGR